MTERYSHKLVPSMPKYGIDTVLFISLISQNVKINFSTAVASAPLYYSLSFVLPALLILQSNNKQSYFKEYLLSFMAKSICMLLWLLLHSFLPKLELI